MTIDARSLRTWGFGVVVSLLVASIPSFVAIPAWGAPWGLDLANLTAFHQCAQRDAPYGVSGTVCGDPQGRPIVYPPLLYWLYIWTRAVRHESAVRIWAAAVASMVLAAGVLWGARPIRPGRPRWQSVLFAGLLVLEFPAVFAMERGNNDAVVLALWTAAAVLFVREKSWASGVFVGIAVATKVYPAVGCVVLAAGAARSFFAAGEARRTVTRLVAGAVLAVSVATIATWGQTRLYVTGALLDFARRLPHETLYSHSVPATFGAAAWAVSALLVGAWSVAAFLRFQAAPAHVFAGALAVSTYVARTSFDYNLVTVYPLLVVQLARALDLPPRTSAASFAVLVLGLVATIGYRPWFGAHAGLHVALQVAWLLASATLVVVTEPARRAEPAAPGR